MFGSLEGQNLDTWMRGGVEERKKYVAFKAFPLFLFLAVFFLFHYVKEIKKYIKVPEKQCVYLY